MDLTVPKGASTCSIGNDASYDAAVARIAELMGCEPGTPESDELNTLVTRVDAWETEHYPIDPPPTRLQR